MQPTPPKDFGKNRLDDERAELYKLRDATWRTHESNKNTGTCEFLKLLLDIHKQIATVDGIGKAAGGADPHAERLKSLESSVAHLGQQIQEIATTVRRVEVATSVPARPPLAHTPATPVVQSEVPNKDKGKR